MYLLAKIVPTYSPRIWDCEVRLFQGEDGSSVYEVTVDCVFLSDCIFFVSKRRSVRVFLNCS